MRWKRLLSRLINVKRFYVHTYKPRKCSHNLIDELFGTRFGLKSHYLYCVHVKATFELYHEWSSMNFITWIFFPPFNLDEYVVYEKEKKNPISHTQLLTFRIDKANQWTAASVWYLRPSKRKKSVGKKKFIFLWNLVT